MPSIGQILREAREKKGASISEVSHATRIKIDYLEKMESDQFDRLIAPAYATSFLRMYSTYLGLNAAEMLEQLRSWQPTKPSASTTAPAPIKTPRKPAMPSSSPPIRAKTESQPTQTRPSSPPAPQKETSRETTVSISGTKAVASPKRQPPQVRPPQSAPAATVSPTPEKPATTPPLRLKEEPKKSSPPPPPAAYSPPRYFPLNATLVVAIVITISLTAIVLLVNRTRRAPTQPTPVELNARETLRPSPARAADVLPLPPPP